MADSILRLKVESQEYDAKIRRAAEGLRRYVDVCHQQGDVIGRLLGDTREYVESIGQMDTVATNAKGQMRELSDALVTLTQVYRGLSDEEKNAPFGQDLSRQIDILTERAGQAKDAMMDVEASIRNAASDTRLFDQMAQGMSVATAGFQGLTGAGKLLGIEMGNDVEVIAKLQAAMAVTNSLTTIQTALQRESALMQGIMAIKTNAAATAQALLARNTVIATAAGKAFNLVAKASPLGLIVTAAAAATAAVMLFGEKSEKVSQQEKDRREVAIRQMQREQAERKRLADRAKEESDAIRNSTGDVIAKYKILQAEWNTLKTSLEKDNFLKENASAFDAWGASIKTAADAQKFFVEQSDKVIKSLKAMARAEAMKDLLKEQYKKNATFDPKNVDKSQYKVTTAEMRQLSPGTIKRKIIASSQTGNVYERLSDGYLNSVIQNHILRNKELSEAGFETGDFKWNTKDVNVTFHMNASGLSKLIEYRKNNYLGKLQEEEDTHTKFLEGQLEEAAAEAAKAQSGITAFKGSGSGGSDNNQTELQKNNALIDQLSTEYVSASDERRAAIRKEIIELQELNEEFNQLKKEAVEGIDANNLLPDIPQSSGPKESYGEQLRKSIFADMQLEARQADVNAIKNLMDVVIRNGIEGVDIPVDDLMERLFGDGGDIAGNYFNKIVEQINEQLKKLGRDQIEFDVNTGNITKKGKKDQEDNKKTEKTVADGMSSLASGMNNVVNGLNSLGVEIPKGLSNVIGGIQTVCSILTGISTIVAAIEVIAGADALIPFTANGGFGKLPHAAFGRIIPGNSFSGDNIFAGGAWVNSGELVLSKAQQGALASQLRDMSRGTDLPPYLTGEMIYLGLQAYTRRAGMGEIITSNR